ncbi:MAG: efflux RND transporter periplasmic adaptor subunit [Candidatus Binatia bacterium]|nr:efflux RND transporter periplasmic adaptor subunit [Candidatus Binatia bacterium]
MAKKWFVLTAVAIGLACGVFAAWRGWPREAARYYKTLHVDRGDITTSVTATGTVNPVTTVQVGTYVSGRIIAIDVDYNSPVKRNQRVAKIDPAPFETKVKKAEAALANARAQVEKDRADLTLKELTWKRYHELFERDLIARADLDQARTAYDQARAQLALSQAAVRQAEADLADAQINLWYTDILSPVDGIVVSRNVNVGQTVAASFQTPTLFLIADDLAKMQVDTAVSESDIGEIREGQQAFFTVDAYGARRFSGTVVQVRNSPTTVQNVVTYDVVVAVDNSDLALKPGMTATVTIVTGERQNVLRVPVRALRFNPSAHATVAQERTSTSTAPRVWVLRNGELAPVELELGLRNDTHAEVVRGDLQPGNQVVVAVEGSASQSKARGGPGPLPGTVRFR